MSDFLRKTFVFGAITLALCLGIRYLLPVAVPFLFGWAVALLSEPLVAPLSGRLKRGFSAGLGVSLTLAVLGVITTLLGAVLVRQLGRLAQRAPELANSARQAFTSLQDGLINLADRAPESIRPRLQKTVVSLLGDGDLLVQQLSQRIPGVVTSAIGKVGNGALGLGTGILSAYLISARLPRLKQGIRERLPKTWQEKTAPALRRVRSALGGWLKAQLKLCAVTWLIVGVGFLVLGIPGAIGWSALVAVVDAIPILGTGTVLVPWAVVCFFRQEGLRAVGLLCIYAAAAITRTVLEPKLVGRQLGLDPLATLAALYLGFRFWGVPGLLLTPILASAVKSLLPRKAEN